VTVRLILEMYESVCDVGVLWLNVRMVQVSFHVRVTTEDSYVVWDGARFTHGKGHLSMLVVFLALVTPQSAFPAVAELVSYGLVAQPMLLEH